MLQDIFPYQLENTFCDSVPALDDFLYYFCDGKVLLKVKTDGKKELPSFMDLNLNTEAISNFSSFLFTVDKVPVYLFRPKGVNLTMPGHLRFFPVSDLAGIFPKWVYFAGITALHLEHWYSNNSYCGKCGSIMAKAQKQRALICSNCRHIVYPAIAPVIIVAVVNKDKLLLTKYLDRSFAQWVLISGFVEIGETLEDAAKREVFEETGVHIKNLKYFGSQPWGFSDSVIVGYIAELDGSDEIKIDTKELAVVAWHQRYNLPNELTDISIAYEMIESLRVDNEEDRNGIIQSKSKKP